MRLKKHLKIDFNRFLRPNNKKSIFIYRFLDGFSGLETRIWCLFAPQGENLHFPGINMMFCIHLRRFGRRFGKIDFFLAKCFFLSIKIDFFNKKSIFHFSKKSIFLIDFFQIKNYVQERVWKSTRRPKCGSELKYIFPKMRWFSLYFFCKYPYQLENIKNS